MSAAIHSKQQVMDLARDLIWLWMSQPVGVRVGVRMDTEKPATTTHTLSLWDFFSLSLSLSLLQRFSTSVVPTQKGSNQRCSGVSLVALYAPL